MGRKTAALALLVLVALAAWTTLEFRGLADPQALALTNPKETSLMRERADEAAEKGKKARRRQTWVGLEAISAKLIQSVVLSEDASFYVHHGVDYVELRHALAESWRRRSLGRGASTITQQLAKNLWLSGSRSLWRKAKELILAKRLEAALPKKRILSIYLNVVEWGDGIYGIEAAAREHFGVSAGELSWAQSAILASMLPAPRRWTPASHSRALESRSLRLLEHLAAYGKVPGEEVSGAKVEVGRLLGKTEGEVDEEPEE